MQYHYNQVNPLKGNTYQLVKLFGLQLIDNTCKVIGQPPVYKDSTSATPFEPATQTPTHPSEVIPDTT